MKRTLTSVLCIATLVVATAARADCSDLWDWLDKGCRRVVDTWKDGDSTVLISGYADHLPFSYTAEKRAELNSDAWGGGYGRSVEDPNGDLNTVYYLGFVDSHKNWQNNVGYAWTTFWGPRDGVQVGLGYSIFIVQRPDIASGVPIPAALPTASIRIQQVVIDMSYVPTLNGGINHGSTLYIFGRVVLK